MRALSALALLLGLAAAPAAALAEDAAVYDVVVNNGRIDPARLEVPAGRRIKLTLSNAGAGPAEFENLDLRVEKVLAPGARSFVVIHPLKPGSYKFVDEFHADTAQLMLIAK